MRAFLLSLAALRDNHTHFDIQVVSTYPRPTRQPLCRAVPGTQQSWSSPVF